VISYFDEEPGGGGGGGGGGVKGGGGEDRDEGTGQRESWEWVSIRGSQRIRPMFLGGDQDRLLRGRTRKTHELRGDY